MERKLQLLKVNLKHFILPHLLLCIVLTGLSPLVIGIENLDAQRTARVLEMFTATTGIIMLTPVCLPEQSSDIRELVESKYLSYTRVVLARIVENLICLMIITGLYIIWLKLNNCSFPMLKYYLGTLTEAFFLGGLGFCALAVFGQIAVGYLLPIMYYIMAFGGGRRLLGSFYPFSMVYGSYREKIYLAVLGLVLFAVGVAYTYFYKKLRYKRWAKSLVNYR